MSKNTNKKGFTIVELLIVIVVIAILAAISIVAYNGIQARSKATSAQSLAAQIQKKAESYNSVKSSYPANKAAFAATDVKEANLDDPAKLVDVSAHGDIPSDEKTVGYKKCSTGAQVYWFNAQTSKREAIGLGGAASSTDVVASSPTSPQITVCS